MTRPQLTKTERIIYQAFIAAYLLFIIVVVGAVLYGSVNTFNAGDTGQQNPLETQIGGDHYKKLGQYQPWEVLKRWLTPEEFRGYMKGTAIAYLARERDKGGDMDIEKSTHTLQGFLKLKNNV